MKVFINFANTRCVVPVGDGSLTVKQVIDLAVERYKKATSKVSNSLSIAITITSTRAHPPNSVRSHLDCARLY